MRRNSRIGKKEASIGSPLIGGPFSLIGQQGLPVADSYFRGKYMLIYFGFTFCPDICPVELKKLAHVVKKLEQRGLADLVSPIFISIDPWRDTVEQTTAYVKEFHPLLVGLTGTPNQILKVAKSFRVYMNKAGEDDNYLVDHSIILYFMGPNGEFIKFFGKNMTEDDIYNFISEEISGKPAHNKTLREHVKAILGV